MTRKTPQDKINQSINLRVNNLKTYKEIQQITGLGWGIICKSLKEYKIPRPRKEKGCLICGSPVVDLNKNIFCSRECWQKTYKERCDSRIRKWQDGLYSGHCGRNHSIKPFVRKFILERENYKCSKCGFSGCNPISNKTILQINHINGDSSNSSPVNLEALCPCCHAMTDNLMGLN